MGQCRACALYTNHVASGQSGWGRLDCTGLVAGRILHVGQGTGQSRQFVFQPGVLVTRTALLAQEAGTASVSNKYLYKLTLTQ